MVALTKWGKAQVMGREKRATDGRPYEREVSRSDGEVAIEKIKKAPPQTAEPPAPLKGSLKGHRCAVLYE